MINIIKKISFNATILCTLLNMANAIFGMEQASPNNIQLFVQSKPASNEYSLLYDQNQYKQYCITNDKYFDKWSYFKKTIKNNTQYELPTNKFQRVFSQGGLGNHHLLYTHNGDDKKCIYKLKRDGKMGYAVAAALRSNKYEGLKSNFVLKISDEKYLLFKIITGEREGAQPGTLAF